MNDPIRSLFPAAQNYTYLNSAAVSPPPTTAIEAINAQLADVSANGNINYLQWVATKNRSRAMLAEMLGARAEQIAFMRNTSDGFAGVAAGLKWEKGDNIVSFANEFPANYYPWRRIRDTYGVELRLAAERDAKVDIDELLSMIDANTRVVAISSVQYASGYRADLERIGLAAKAVDALFCVDVIQGLGATAYDLPSLHVDVASGGGHKWLCAPEGCGFVYLSDRAREMIEPVFVGWISVGTPWDFVDREQSFKPNALAWESGTSCSALYYGLEQSLKIFKDLGAANIENHLNDLTDHLCDSLGGKDYDIVSSRAPGEKSAIVCIKHRNGLHANDVAGKLEAEKVIISPRGDRIRIAPHFYNNIEDIDRLIEALP